MEIRPRLKYLGSFGLQCSIKRAFIKIPLGLRRRAVVQVDDARGVRKWSFVYKVMPGTLEGGIEDDNSNLQSRADYLWNFYNERKESGDATFIITCPRDGKNYLVCFEEDELSYELFNVRLWSSRLSLVQVDEDDVETMPDGSLAEATGNPAQM